MRKSSMIALLVFACAMALTACSDGGGSGAVAEIGGGNPSGPVAVAGTDQIVLTGSEVTLDAGGSYPANGNLAYSWDFMSVPDGSGIDASDLSDPTSAYPTFTPDVDGDYVLRLVVNDEGVDSAPDFVTITASSAPLPAAYWNFEEGVGTVAADSAGTNHGTLIGPPNWTTGQVGTYALAFNGVDDYVSVPHADLFNADLFTLSFWLYNINDTNNTSKGIIRKTGSWHVRKDSVNQLQFCMERVNEGPECSSIGYTIPDRQWDHYAIVVDNTSPEATFYINGVSLGTHLFTSRFANTSRELFIGQFALGNRFYGLIDDVKFYDSPLAPVEP
jgi:hypothetical protein